MKNKYEKSGNFEKTKIKKKKKNFRFELRNKKFTEATKTEKQNSSKTFNEKFSITNMSPFLMKSCKKWEGMNLFSTLN